MSLEHFRDEFEQQFRIISEDVFGDDDLDDWVYWYAWFGANGYEGFTHYHMNDRTYLLDVCHYDYEYSHMIFYYNLEPLRLGGLHLTEVFLLEEELLWSEEDLHLFEEDLYLLW